jgi:putative Mn2+ efflux pump MntP
LLIFEAVLLSATLSADAFIVSLSYGGGGVRIGLCKAALISLVSSAVLGVSLFAGAMVRGFLPVWLTAWVCFAILFTIGLYKIFGKIKDETQVKALSAAEAVLLAAALSLDGLAVGFGAAMGSVNIWAALAASLLMNLLAVTLGCALGMKLSKKAGNGGRQATMNRLAGAVLIGLAMFNLF